MTLWKFGLILLIAGGTINAVLINLEIGGILRELTRLSIIVGFILFVFGLLRRKKAK
jgi:hypothetical protein